MLLPDGVSLQNALPVVVMHVRTLDHNTEDSLAEADKITLETARFLKDDFLQQNSFTPYDKYCPFYKSVGMLKNIVTFHELANQAVERTAGSAPEHKITYNAIKARLSDLMYKVTAQKFEDPATGEDAITKKLDELNDQIKESFRNLEEDYR